MKSRLVYDFLRDLKIPLDGRTQIQVNGPENKHPIRIYRAGYWLDLIHEVDAAKCSEVTGVPLKTIAKLSEDYRKGWVKTGPDSHYPGASMTEAEIRRCEG